MDWPRFWSHYIQMWEDRYDYIPTREPIIIPELACIPEYMPWFRIHGKPYLLLEDERQQQLRIQRERRGPLNPRRRDETQAHQQHPHNHLAQQQDLHSHRAQQFNRRHPQHSLFR
ncbi:hypothetical protein PVK06_027995 [Gossypium arboreum]|uniref:Uncharacterized protein n=1 Tax=Gossypium arboreum TaxID=29729 RepID=A0ABR0P341_GOSAR|nr:hypothetical protein PVK06_027995 [Gossypium arboreum]